MIQEQLPGYITDLLVPSDSVLDATLQAGAEAMREHLGYIQENICIFAPQAETVALEVYG